MLQLLEKLKTFRDLLERESGYPHWSGDQRYVFRLVKKWLAEIFEFDW